MISNTITTTSFNSLKDDNLRLILKFVGKKSYRGFGEINKRCWDLYNASGLEKETFWYGYVPFRVIIHFFENRHYEFSVGRAIVYFGRFDLLLWVLMNQKSYVFYGICAIAAEAGKLDILELVYDNCEDDVKQSIQERGLVFQKAASGKIR